jgi:aminopeptidase N
MKFILFVFIGLPVLLFSQSKIDVQHYSIHLNVNDTNNIIHVVEDITITFLETCATIDLDLTDQDALGTGMKVSSVQHRIFTDIERTVIPVEFSQSNEKLSINTPAVGKGDKATYRIEFEGIPKDGLVIGENKFGDRTFFGDNWPTRAHNWFACVDHPSDKATVQFFVTAPSHYKCISNGVLAGVSDQGDGTTQTDYVTDIQLPTKVMVVGIAEFEVNSMDDESTNNHLSIWSYPQDYAKGNIDMKVARDPLAFYSTHVAPYPFEKLANVQSTTRFGGMENAGCIFYDEKAVTGNAEMENLIAHEIAHQWFGNSASESDWQHLWLSEGFATYFTNLYIEDKYGRVPMNMQLIKDRAKVIRFHNQIQLPIIDTLSTDLMRLLNPNAYQKGSWVLHMLRDKIGDKIFWEGIRTYYDTYKFSNASSNDFIAVMEKAAGFDLTPFFDQWLRRSGHPQLKVSQKVQGKRKKATTVITIEQVQKEGVFKFPLEVIIEKDGAELKSEHIMITKKKYEIVLDNIVGNVTVTLDPDVNLLFEEVK